MAVVASLVVLNGMVGVLWGSILLPASWRPSLPTSTITWTLLMVIALALPYSLALLLDIQVRQNRVRQEAPAHRTRPPAVCSVLAVMELVLLTALLLGVVAAAITGILCWTGV